MNTWLRLQANATVDAGLRMFATCRPPGIYKDDYIEELFRYHHERRCVPYCNVGLLCGLSIVIE